jgi:uncharacterized protein
LAFVLVALAAVVSGCSDSGPKRASELNVRTVTLPSGTKIRAQILSHPSDIMRGMKFRDALPEGEGMLFMHTEEGHYRYWMYEVRVPLDMIWLNRRREIVQIVHNCPPCPGPESACPSYGGAFKAQYVLELAAGGAAKHNLKPGMVLSF